MRIDERVRCSDFPCVDVDHTAYVVPGLELDPSAISLLMISEAAPAGPDDWFYASGEPVFAQTTLQAFLDAQNVAKDIAAALEVVRRWQ